MEYVGSDIFEQGSFAFKSFLSPLGLYLFFLSSGLGNKIHGINTVTRLSLSMQVTHIFHRTL